jgi:hypothetical protein
MSIQIFVTLFAISVKIGMKNLNMRWQNYSFYLYKHDCSGYFHDFGKKSLFVSSVLKGAQPNI